MVATLANSPAPAWLYIACWVFCIALAWVVTALMFCLFRPYVTDDYVDEGVPEVFGCLCFIGFCVGGFFSVVLPACMVIDLWPR